MQYDPNFVKALHFTLKWEGGYVNNPADPGGATKYGISLPYAQSVGLDKDKDGDVDADDIKALTVEDAMAKYFSDFWTGFGCGNYPSPFCIALFDTVVQHSPSGVNWILEQANGDWRKLIDARRQYAMAWINRKPKERVQFQKGFINRYNDLRKLCEIEEVQ